MVLALEGRAGTAWSCSGVRSAITLSRPAWSRFRLARMKSAAVSMGPSSSSAALVPWVADPEADFPGAGVQWSGPTEARSTRSARRRTGWTDATFSAPWPAVSSQPHSPPSLSRDNAVAVRSVHAVRAVARELKIELLERCRLVRRGAGQPPRAQAGRRRRVSPGRRLDDRQPDGRDHRRREDEEAADHVLGRDQRGPRRAGVLRAG